MNPAYAFLCALLSGLLSFYAFYDPSCSWLMWVALAPFILALRGKSFWQTTCIALVFSFCYIGGLAAGFSQYDSLLYIAFTIYRTLYIVAWALLFRHVSSCAGLPAHARIAFGACAWVACEFAENYLFNGSGRGILAYSQYANTYLIQIASFLGVESLSFCIMLVNLALAYLVAAIMRARKISPDALMYGGVIVAILAGLAMYGRLAYNRVQMSESPDKVAVIQGNIPAGEKWLPEKRVENLAVYQELIMRAAASSPRLIIWPESSVPGFLSNTDELLKRLTSFTESLGIPLLIGITSVELRGGQNCYYNSAVLLTPGGAAERYDKMLLIPFSEFRPSAFRFCGRDNSPSGAVSIFSGAQFLVFKAGALSFSSVICSEINFPRFVSRVVKQGVDFVVNPTNEAYAGKSNLAVQQLAMAVFRAVENRITVIRAANSALSCFIDPRGAIRQIIIGDRGERFDVRDYIVGPVFLTSARHPSGMMSGVFIALAILVSAAILAYSAVGACKKR